MVKKNLYAIENLTLNYKKEYQCELTHSKTRRKNISIFIKYYRGNIRCCRGKFSHSRNVFSSSKVNFDLGLQNNDSEFFFLNLKNPYLFLF